SFRKRSLYMATYSLGQLAQILGCEVAGDAEIEIRGVATLEAAGPGEIAFLANMKYAPLLKTTRAAAVIAAEAVKESGAATLISQNPYHDFARALALFYEAPKPAPGIHPTACIAETAVVGRDASIGAYAVV